jgi:myosin-5
MIVRFYFFIFAVSAVLEHEAIAGLTGSKPSGLRGRSSSRAEDTPEHSLDTLMKSVSIVL